MLILFWVVFVPLFFFNYPERPHQLLFHIVRSLSLGVSIGVVVAYAPAARQILFKRSYLSGGEGLVLGIFFFWFGLLGHMLVNFLAQFSDNPPAVVHGDWALISWWTSLSGALIVFLSSGEIEPVTLRGAWKLGAFLAVFISMAFIAAYVLNLERWFG